MGTQHNISTIILPSLATGHCGSFVHDCARGGAVAITNAIRHATLQRFDTHGRTQCSWAKVIRAKTNYNTTNIFISVSATIRSNTWMPLFTKLREAWCYHLLSARHLLPFMRVHHSVYCSHVHWSLWAFSSVYSSTVRRYPSSAYFSAWRVR